MYFSAPGRTEIGGNHTDHQHGRVLAAAVKKLDSAVDNGLIEVYGAGRGRTYMLSHKLYQDKGKVIDRDILVSVNKGRYAKYRLRD